MRIYGNLEYLQPSRINSYSGGSSVFGTVGGDMNTFSFHNQQIVIADGPDQYGRRYYAFPDLTKIGNTYWLCYMANSSHAGSHGSVVVKSSTDCINWSLVKEFQASSPYLSATPTVGDTSYIAGSIADLGGSNMVCVLEQTTLSSGSTLIDATYWSVSNDNGGTWSNPTMLPNVNNTYPSVAGLHCLTWKNTFYLPTFGMGAFPQYGNAIYYCSAESLISGSPNWNHLSANSGQEPCVMVNPSNPDELWVVGRANNTYLSYITSTDGINWGSVKRVYWDVTTPIDVGMKPLMCRTENNNWIVPKRKTPGQLDAEVMVGADPFIIYAGGAATTWPNVIQRSVPNPVSTLNERGWNGVEKLLYMGMVPLKGDLVAVVYSSEPQEQFNSPVSVTGKHASVFFSFFGSGTGKTPYGTFVPATQELFNLSTISLSNNTTSYRKWLSAGDTQIKVNDGSNSATVEILGDYTPTFVDGNLSPITPTGSYALSCRNVATITPGPSITISSSPAPSPMEIPGLSASVIIQLSPSGIVYDGSNNVIRWTNEGRYSTLSAYTAVGLQLSSTSTPNNNNSVQGKNNGYLSAPTSVNTPVYAVYALASNPTSAWATYYPAIMTNVIQGKNISTNVFQWSDDFTGDFNHQMDGVIYDSSTMNPQGWHIHSALIQSPGAITPATPASLEMLLNQPGILTRWWRGQLAALVVLDTRIPSNRQDYLIRRWLRSL